MSRRDRSNAEHYHWGDGCEGWRLVDTPGLSVIEERMPPGCSEHLHLHEHATQYFHILSGEALFEVEGREELIREGEGIHIIPQQRHRVRNPGAGDLRFLLASSPSTRGDRIDLEP